MNTTPSRPRPISAVWTNSPTVAGAPTSMVAERVSRTGSGRVSQLMPRSARNASRALSAASALGARISDPSRETRISARSRPSSAQCLSRASSLRGISAGAQVRLLSFAKRATRRSVRRSPLPPIRLGGPPDWSGAGELTASWLR